MGVDSLVPIHSLEERVRAWHDVSGRKVDVRIGNLTDAAFTYGVVAECKPDAIVHFGEQRSAPYSMIDREHAVYTQVNNVVGHTERAVRHRRDRPLDPPGQARDDGRVRTPNIDIEEGFIEITHKGRTDGLPFPKQPGSFYHLSKVHDSHNIVFACRVVGPALHRPEPGHRLRPGDPRGRPAPGPGHPLRLRRRVRHGLEPLRGPGRHGLPLTVYGKGGQTRGMFTSSTPWPASAGPEEPGRGGRVPGVQPVHRVLLRAGHGRHGQTGVPQAGGDRRGTAQSQGRARGALLPRGQHQAVGSRPRAAPARPTR